jgi:3-phytase
MTGMSHVSRWTMLLAGAVASACSAPEDGALMTGREAGAPTGQVAVVSEVFETPRDTLENVDSPAVWHGPDGQHWVLATAKSGNVIRVSDARTGELLDRVGGTGEELGRMRRPNGIAVIDDVMVVVERDNGRVQLFALPGFEPLGTFGEDHLKLPYGVAVYAEAPESYMAYVTDAWETEEDVVPPDSLLDDRVHQFRFSVRDGALEVEHIRHFGETTGPGVLHVVESIAVDVEHGRLLIAEEEEGDSKIMVYSLDGIFTGEIIGDPWFASEAEGIALYACGDGGGYWLATDQGMEGNTFHVFDRESLEHRGSFRGRTVTNTDGIALTQRPYEGFPAGAFFAVHNDQSTVAFSWADIAQELGLRADCPAPESMASAGWTGGGDDH